MRKDNVKLNPLAWAATSKRLKQTIWFALCAMGSIAFVLGMSNQNLYADEVKGKSEAAAITNIGFMENPPKEVREKFPMCDTFLKVDWIDKEKKAGFTTVDFFLNGSKYRSKWLVLVYLGDDGQIFINVEKAKKQGELKKLTTWVKRGEFVYNIGPKGEGGLDLQGPSGAFWDIGDSAEDLGAPAYDVSLGDWRKNVCIPYPDGQRAYFAELKEMQRVHSADEIARTVAQINASIPTPLFFDKPNVIDLNLDGVEDYWAGNAFIYSSNGRYYDMRINDSDDIAYGHKLVSPTNAKTCLFPTGEREGFYLSTDGKNVFLNNKCNLTELTKGGK